MKLKVLLMILVIFSVASCHTESRIVKQTAKAMAGKHALAAAQVVRAKYPCIPSAPDSSKFIASIENLKNLLNKETAKASSNKAEVKRVADSLRSHYKNSVDRLEDCISTTQELFDYSAALQVRVDSLYKVIAASTKRFAEIQYQLEHIQPVLVPTRDSIEGAQHAADMIKAGEEISKWRNLYEIDHKWRQDMEEKDRKNFILYIPNWLMYTLAGLAALLLFSVIQGFNPLLLLRRKNKSHEQ